MIVKMNVNLSTPKRGRLLLDLERRLRAETGRPIEVYLEPRVDANKLRVKLRGVKV